MAMDEALRQSTDGVIYSPYNTGPQTHPEKLFILTAGANFLCFPATSVNNRFNINRFAAKPAPARTRNREYTVSG